MVINTLSTPSYIYEVETLLRDYPWGSGKWPLNRGWGLLRISMRACIRTATKCSNYARSSKLYHPVSNYSDHKISEKMQPFFLNLSLFMEHFLASFSSLFLPKGGILQHWLWEVLGPAVPCTPTSGCSKLVLVLWNAIAAKTWDAYMFRSPENSLSVLKLTPLRTREPLLHPQDGYHQTNDNSRAILLQKRKCGEQLDEDRGYLKLWALSESYWFDYDSTMTSNFT